MTIKRNTFAGITSGTNITAASQTGGASGDQFDTWTITGTGVTAQVNTSADLADQADRGLIINPNGQANMEASGAWTHAALNVTYHEIYYRTNSAVPNTSTRIAIGFSGATRVWEAREMTTGHFQVVDWTSGNSIIQTTNAMARSTIYRLEWKVALTDLASDLKVFIGDQTTGEMAVSRFGFGITGANLTWNSTKYGLIGGTTAPNWSPNMAAFGWSDTALLGPYVSAAQAPVTYGRHITIGG